MRTRALLCLAFALYAADAHGDIYRCAREHGVTVYQNFPCEFASLGSVPADGAPDGKASALASAPTSGPANAARAAKTTAARPNVAIQTAATGASQPRVGSSDDDVRKAWGAPEEVIQDEPPSGPIEIWRYKDGRSVQIRRHRVVATQP